jgi:proteasome activator subunit 4
MESNRQTYEDLIPRMVNGRNGNEISRATSPGGELLEMNGIASDDSYKRGRNRPRTYPYFKHLPYEVEDEIRRQHDLQEILKYLYIAVEAGDFTPGAIHWTRELRSWLSLKFDPTKEQRVRLVKLYYELSLAPGIEPSVAERFSSMFMLLTK